MICGRSFGCLRHGNLKYSDYNIAPSNLFEVPEILIFKFKDQIRYEIKKNYQKITQSCVMKIYFTTSSKTLLNDIWMKGIMKVL